MAFLRLAVIIALWANTTAFSVSPRSATRADRVCMEMASDNNFDLSRRSFFDGAVAATASALLLTAVPQVVNADVTNKVASTTALRNVKRAQRQLATIKPYVEDDDYEPIKEAFRAAPFSEIRKNMSTLIKGGEDGPLAESLQENYLSFKTTVERLDSMAGQALRGKKIPNDDLVAQYNNVESALAAFVKVAEESVEIPLQEGEAKEATI